MSVITQWVHDLILCVFFTLTYFFSRVHCTTYVFSKNNTCLQINQQIELIFYVKNAFACLLFLYGSGSQPFLLCALRVEF